ncbi:MAG: hypothetical protein RIQ62_1476, partial [Bacteroidota bacterium]
KSYPKLYNKLRRNKNPHLLLVCIQYAIKNRLENFTSETASFYAEIFYLFLSYHHTSMGYNTLFSAHKTQLLSSSCLDRDIGYRNM